ncbi:hypothetical protein QBZ16_000836 [Prototheca wickerhamii]|uniref:GrpE protein homolog n=1 Tax=Prototheca wickerhamii TaxID=3111 RepID=A0AAD9IHG5_PROWI|nr:hypothetical protein QBZ16_000836 [Prototheca wickerhamii]
MHTPQTPALTTRSFVSSPSCGWAAQEGDGKEAAKAGDEAAEAPEAGPVPAPEELEAEVARLRGELEGERKAAAEAKDRLMRTLADMENLRQRTQRQIAETKQFAVQSVVKSFVEVVDNLERAIESVPLAELEAEAEAVDRAKALKLLKSLHDGVVLTESITLKLLEKEGVTRYDPLGQPFDPNLHNAMFNVPAAAANSEPGLVAVVVKKGYLLHDRPVRAADVGVAQ